MYDRKDFLSLSDIRAEEILYLLDTAETMKYVLSQKNKKVPYLQGKSVILLFYDKSSRTKLSYELAAQYLSANLVDLTVAHEHQFADLSDMGRLIDQMGGDMIVLRHPSAGSAKYLAENSSASVINAGDGINENPSQSLLDLLTIKSQKGSFEGLNVTIIGDIARSRVTRSNLWALLKLGAKVSVAGPPTLMLPELEDFGVKVFYDCEEAIVDTDVIMVLRMQYRNDHKCLIPSANEYGAFFKIDEKKLKYAKEDVIIMHPGPINSSVEISQQVINSKHCLINDQIANGVAVRMALLYLMSMRGGIKC